MCHIQSEHLIHTHTHTNMHAFFTFAPFYHEYDSEWHRRGSHISKSSNINGTIGTVVRAIRPLCDGSAQCYPLFHMMGETKKKLIRFAVVHRNQQLNIKKIK